MMALSSGEAELYAATKASAECRGIRSIFRGIGVSASVKVHVDASAAFGMINRRGLGKVRHIDVQTLWVQEAAARNAIQYRKLGVCTTQQICAPSTKKDGASASM